MLVKKAGLMDTWTRLERKAAEVTPASIELMLRANRVSSASLSDYIFFKYFYFFYFLE